MYVRQVRIPLDGNLFRVPVIRSPNLAATVLANGARMWSPELLRPLLPGIRRCQSCSLSRMLSFFASVCTSVHPSAGAGRSAQLAAREVSQVGARLSKDSTATVEAVAAALRQELRAQLANGSEAASGLARIDARLAVRASSPVLLLGFRFPFPLFKGASECLVVRASSPGRLWAFFAIFCFQGRK
jgi:hypothetical protein